MLTTGIESISLAMSMTTGVVVNLIAFVLAEVVFRPVLARMGYPPEASIARKAHSEEALSVVGVASALPMSSGEDSVHIYISVMSHSGTVITVLVPHGHVTVHVSGDAQKPPTTKETQ